MSSLNDITAGGAPRPVSHVERLQQEFPDAQPALGYGLTETNAAGCTNFWGNYAAKPASTGRAQKPFVELAILGAGDAHLPTGERGEIAIRSAANIKGYWRNPAATEALFTADGYVRTGDIGYLDEDGYLFIVDRKKEIIIRGGENISAAEVEAACYACPDVAEARCSALPTSGSAKCRSRSSMRRTAAASTKPDCAPSSSRAWPRSRSPRGSIFADEPLPRLGTGKIDRLALKAQHAH